MSHWNYCWRSPRTCDQQLTRELDQGNEGPSLHPLSLGCVFLLPSPLPQAASGIKPGDRCVVLRLSELGLWRKSVKSSHMHDWNQLRPLCKLFKILVSGCRELLILRPPKTSLVSKPATYPSGERDLPLSSVSSFPPCIGTNFRIYPWNSREGYKSTTIQLLCFQDLNIFILRENTCFHVSRPMGIWT